MNVEISMMSIICIGLYDSLSLTDVIKRHINRALISSSTLYGGNSDNKKIPNHQFADFVFF